MFLNHKIQIFFLIDVAKKIEDDWELQQFGEDITRSRKKEGCGILVCCFIYSHVILKGWMGNNIVEVSRIKSRLTIRGTVNFTIPLMTNTASSVNFPYHPFLSSNIPSSLSMLFSSHSLHDMPRHTPHMNVLFKWKGLANELLKLGYLIGRFNHFWGSCLVDTRSL